MRIRKFAVVVDANDDALVERPGPGMAPTAFRIFAAGANHADDGAVYFTEDSATALLAEQDARGRLYPFDFDHLSLLPDRPAEAGRASGWHRLAVRDGAEGPELWAVEIEWCVDAKAGLEEQPPRWRYFSPAFSVGKGAEVTSYVNCALCINPKTHGLPALAAMVERKEQAMDPEKKKSVLAALLAKAASDDEKSALQAAIDDLGGDEEKKAEDCGDEKKDAVEPDDDEEKEVAGDKSDEKEGEKEKSHSRALAADVVALNEKVERLEREKAVENELKKHPHIPDSFRAWALGENVNTVRAALAQVKNMNAMRGAKPTQGAEGLGAVQLQGAEREAMDRAMGINRNPVKMPSVDPATGVFTLHTVRPTDFRAFMAEQAKKGA